MIRKFAALKVASLVTGHCFLFFLLLNGAVGHRIEPPVLMEQGRESDEKEGGPPRWLGSVRSGRFGGGGVVVVAGKDYNYYLGSNEQGPNQDSIMQVRE